MTRTIGKAAETCLRRGIAGSAAAQCDGHDTIPRRRAWKRLYMSVSPHFKAQIGYHCELLADHRQQVVL